MEVEVMIPAVAAGAPAASDFNFDSACTSPYISAPSSPQRFGTSYYSAPPSPTRATAFYDEFNRPSSSVRFNWEEKPGVSRAREADEMSCYTDEDGAIAEERDTDFSFDFSGHLEKISLSADELFDGGKIKPLKPPPRLHYEYGKPPDSPKSPKKRFGKAFSPRHKIREEFDLFAAAIEHTRKENMQEVPRGRERSSSSSRHKQTRSLSPFRVSDLLFEPDNNDQEGLKNSSLTSLFSTSFSSFWYKKWKIKDLLLFRSASESRATDQDEFKKYALLKKTHQDDVKYSSFRSTESVGSLSTRRRRRGPPISSHELHYNVKRALAEEMKKKTFLPYRQGLLGCLGFNPDSVHNMTTVSKGLGPTASLSRR